jgi:Tfp pilus assembly protein PilE
VKKPRNQGFGKVELIISIMIIGVLIFLSTPIYNSWKVSEQETSPSSETTPMSPNWNSGLEENTSEFPVQVLPQE